MEVPGRHYKVTGDVMKGQPLWHHTSDNESWGEFYRWLVSEKLRIPTGFATFDKACAGGLQQGWLVSLCGADQSGKSMMLLRMALTASSAGYTVGLINLDMDWRIWFLRMLAKQGGHSASRLLEMDQFEIGEGEKLKETMARVRDLPGNLILDNSMPATISQVKESMDRLIAKGAKLVMVDYLQLIEPDRKGTDFVAGFDNVVKGIRRHGLQHGVPIVCAAQLNRRAKLDEAPHVWHVLGGTALERHGDINVVIDHRKQQITDNVTKIHMTVEKNRPVGRLLDWYVRLDQGSLEMMELESRKAHAG